AFSLAGAAPFVDGWLAGLGARSRVGRWLTLYALPPAVIVVLARIVAHPAYARLRAAGWPSADRLGRVAPVVLGLVAATLAVAAVPTYIDGTIREYAQVLLAAAALALAAL